MGSVRLDENGSFEVRLAGREDHAALKAALKATPGTDSGEATEQGGILTFEPDNSSNVVAFWAAGFDWDTNAVRTALDLIVPMAWQQIGIHSSVSRRIGRKEKELINSLRDIRKKSD